MLIGYGVLIAMVVTIESKVTQYMVSFMQRGPGE